MLSCEYLVLSLTGFAPQLKTLLHVNFFAETRTESLLVFVSDAGLMSGRSATRIPPAAADVGL